MSASHGCGMIDKQPRGRALSEAYERQEPKAPTFYSEREWRIDRRIEGLHERSGTEIPLAEFKKKASWTQYMALLADGRQRSGPRQVPQQGPSGLRHRASRGPERLPVSL
jgi:hypothetical protein